MQHERWAQLYQPDHGPYYSYDWGRPPKIALIGTCSVGKTSIKQYFKDNPFIEPGIVVGHVDEVAERFFTSGLTADELEELADNHPVGWGELPHFKTHWITSLPRTWWWTQHNIGECITAAEEDARAQYASVLLCDRALLCSMVYTWAHGDKDHAKGMMESGYFWLPTYTELALLDPTDVPYVQTAVRSETPQERLRIHEAYLEFCDYFHVPYTLVRGSLEERIIFVQSMLVNAYEFVREEKRN